MEIKIFKPRETYQFLVLENRDTFAYNLINIYFKIYLYQSSNNLKIVKGKMFS